MAPDQQPLSVSSWTPPDSPEPEELGGKAVGVLQLQRDWVPPFVVLGRRFFHAWQAAGRSAATLLGQAEGPDRAALAELIDKARALGAAGLIVRSNAPSEATSETRGRYESFDTRFDETEVFAAIDRVLAQSSATDPVFAIVQARVRRRLVGHLSNERRVAERPVQWLIEEIESDGPGPPASKRIEVGRFVPTTLDVGDRKSVHDVLRGIAFDLRAGRRGRVHCEWTWDGKRLWVLQRDTVRPRENERVAEFLKGGPADLAPAPGPSDLRRVRRLSAEEASGWTKLRRRDVMHAAALPVAPVYAISAADFAADEAAGFPDLRHDLAALTAGDVPLMIRSDVLAGSDIPHLSLPASDPTTSVAALLEWMSETAGDFKRRGAAPGRWGFLLASLVAGRASAMVQARPGTQLIRMDALWGYPDGLRCLPHDSYFVRTGAHPEIRRRKAYKGTCMLHDPGQEAAFEAVPPPYDWQEVLTDEEILLAADWAQRLADPLGNEVQLMVLARVNGRRGPEGMVPWHYTDHTVPQHRSTVPMLPAGELAEVKEPADLSAIEPDRHRGLLFRPTAEQRRDVGLIESVGERAAELRLPIYFEGSILGHTFYLLGSEGASVIAVGSTAPDMEEVEYNKLVRDRIPEIVEASGGGARAVRAGPEQAGWLLRQKLIEEAFEVWSSGDEEIVGELADLTEVVHAIYAHLGIDPAAVEAARAKKRDARGGFDSLTYLESTVPDGSVEDPLDPDEDALFNPTSAIDQTARSHDQNRRVEVDESPSRVLFRVPAVPPLVQGIPWRQYTVTVGAAVVRFRHDGSHLEFTVEQHKEEEASAQLSLLGNEQ